jgi:TPR repeat protein
MKLGICLLNFAMLTVAVFAMPCDAAWTAKNDESNRQRAMESIRQTSQRGEANAASRQAAFDRLIRPNASNASTINSSSRQANSGNTSSPNRMNAGTADNGGGQSVNSSETFTIYRQENPAQMIARLSQEAGENPRAEHDVGMFHYSGYAGQRNDIEARRWFARAAARGYARSQGMLGYFILKGFGGAQSEVEAEKWFRLAVLQDDVFAEMQYGMLLSTRVGHPNYEPKRAIHFHTKAADKGDVNSSAMAGLTYIYGDEGVPADYVKAAKYLRVAAESGHGSSMEFLASLYCKGQGVSQSIPECFRWLKMAAELGEAKALANYGLELVRGEHVPKDIATGAAYVKKSAEAGNLYGQFNLALLYHDGLGVTVDGVQTLAWLRRAAAQGHPEADAFLARDYMVKIAKEHDAAKVVK